jgi:flagellar protein FlaG
VPAAAPAHAKIKKAEKVAPEPALRTNSVEVPKKTSVDLEEGIKKIEEIVSRMNQEMQSQKRGLSFAFDKAINTHVVTVTSVNSGEVIRQIPTEVVVRVAHNIEKLKGVLFDGKY